MPNGSRKIAPKENCPSALILMLILNQTLILTEDNFPRGQFSGHHFSFPIFKKFNYFLEMVPTDNNRPLNRPPC